MVIRLSINISIQRKKVIILVVNQKMTMPKRLKRLYINVVFQFKAKGESLGYFWSVSCQYKKRLTKEAWRALLLAGLLLSMVTCLCCNVSGRRVVLGIALSLRLPVK
jgi:hypothetical protein